MTAETDLRPVMWRAPRRGGGWMYFDHDPTHLLGVEPLFTAHAIAPLQAEIEALRDLCGMAYQLAGAHDAPEEWLDALSNAAAGRPFSTDALLPYIPQEGVATISNDLHYAETAFGFEYGAATVERACSDKAKGWVVLLLRTPKHPDGLQLYVTKTGKVRVYAAGQEWKP